MSVQAPRGADFVSFVEFVELGSSPSGKTRLWTVRAKDGCGELGMVKFFGRWRCYAFFPAAGTVFEEDCLRDIASFCETQTNSWRKKGAIE